MRERRQVGYAAAPFAEDAGGVGLVEQQQAVVAVGQLGQLGERGQVAVHAKDGIRHDQPPPGATPFAAE